MLTCNIRGIYFDSVCNNNSNFPVWNTNENKLKCNYFQRPCLLVLHELTTFQFISVYITQKLALCQTKFIPLTSVWIGKLFAICKEKTSNHSTYFNIMRQPKVTVFSNAYFLSITKVIMVKVYMHNWNKSDKYPFHC